MAHYPKRVWFNGTTHNFEGVVCSQQCHMVLSAIAQIEGIGTTEEESINSNSQWKACACLGTCDGTDDFHLANFKILDGLNSVIKDLGQTKIDLAVAKFGEYLIDNPVVNTKLVMFNPQQQLVFSHLDYKSH